MPTDPQIESLANSALKARKNAYAPYSEFAVGAAVLTHHGRVYTGCNVENASYGLCICAERTAIVKAISEGESKLVAIAVATSGGGTPCGACRQFISEFSDDETIVIIQDADSETPYRIHTVTQLLPAAFSAKDL